MPRALVKWLSINRRDEMSTVTIGHRKAFIVSIRGCSRIRTWDQTRDWIITYPNAIFSELVGQINGSVDDGCSIFILLRNSFSLEKNSINWKPKLKSSHKTMHPTPYNSSLRWSWTSSKDRENSFHWLRSMSLHRIHSSELEEYFISCSIGNKKALVASLRSNNNFIFFTLHTNLLIPNPNNHFMMMFGCVLKRILSLQFNTTHSPRAWWSTMVTRFAVVPSPDRHLHSVSTMCVCFETIFIGIIFPKDRPIGCTSMLTID